MPQLVFLNQPCYFYFNFQESSWSAICVENATAFNQQKRGGETLDRLSRYLCPSPYLPKSQSPDGQNESAEIPRSRYMVVVFVQPTVVNNGPVNATNDRYIYISFHY